MTSTKRSALYACVSTEEQAVLKLPRLTALRWQGAQRSNAPSRPPRLMRSAPEDVPGWATIAWAARAGNALVAVCHHW